MRHSVAGQSACRRSFTGQLLGAWAAQKARPGAGPAPRAHIEVEVLDGGPGRQNRGQTRGVPVENKVRKGWVGRAGGAAGAGRSGRGAGDVCRAAGHPGRQQAAGRCRPGCRRRPTAELLRVRRRCPLPPGLRASGAMASAVEAPVLGAATGPVMRCSWSRWRVRKTSIRAGVPSAFAMRVDGGLRPGRGQEGPSGSCAGGRCEGRST